MRSDREILRLANENIKELTNEEFDRYNELIKMPITDRMAMGGKACRGRSAASSAEKS